MDQTLRMYAIERGDLDMTRGKCSSQTGHAYKLLTKNVVENNPTLSNEYFDDGMGTNVTLKSKNLSQLERAYDNALDAGLPCVLITDEGHIMPPHFDGEPIVTVIGIGPCRRAEVHHITKKFNCVK